MFAFFIGENYERSRGVGLDRGVGLALGAGVGVDVGVAVVVGVAVGVGVGVGAPLPPQTIISAPVQTAV